MDRAELARRLNFSFVIPGRLAGLGWPGLRGTDPAVIGDFLHAEGVGLLLNLTEEPDAELGPRAPARLRLPVVDYEPPALAQLDAAWERLLALGPGEALAVHCAAGVGRTGTVLAALLGRARGRGAAEAIAELRRLRPHSVETLAQERRVAEWLAIHLR